MMVARKLTDLSQKLAIYERLLKKWQKSINLVSGATLSEAKKRHFEDSLQLLDFIPEKQAVLFDLGSGAGFPGLVLAMARPELGVTLIESDTKKCTYLSTVSRETMSPVTIWNQRIEDVSRETIPDIVTARALASLDKLFGLCLDWAQANPNLLFLFLKGEKAEEEIEAAGGLYDFDVESVSSRTGNGFVLKVTNLSVKS